MPDYGLSLNSLLCVNLQTMRTQLATLERSQAELERKYAEAEVERDELYDKFEGMVRLNLHFAAVGGCGVEWCKWWLSCTRSSESICLAVFVRMIARETGYSAPIISLHTLSQPYASSTAATGSGFSHPLRGQE